MRAWVVPGMALVDAERPGAGLSGLEGDAGLLFRLADGRAQDALAVFEVAAGQAEHAGCVDVPRAAQEEDLPLAPEDHVDVNDAAVAPGHDGTYRERWNGSAYTN